MLVTVGMSVRSQQAPSGPAQFARTLSYVGPRVLLPSSVLVPVTGVAMVLDGAGWRFTQLWILLALGLFMVAFLIGLLQVGRVGIRLADEGRADNPASSTIAGLLNQWLIWYGVVLVTLIAAVADMVFKPGM